MKRTVQATEKINLIGYPNLQSARFSKNPLSDGMTSSGTASPHFKPDSHRKKSMLP